MVKYAIIKGDRVANVVVVAEGSKWSDPDAIPCPDNVGPGDLWDGQKFSRPVPAPDTDAEKRAARKSALGSLRSALAAPEPTTRPTTVAGAMARVESLEQQVRMLQELVLAFLEGR